MQKAHIMKALRAFFRFKIQRITTGITWFETKLNATRNAVNQFIRNPIYALELKLRRFKSFLRKETA